MKTVYIVTLNYSIRFRDSDEGNCYAGDGQRIVRVLSDKGAANDLIKDWNPTIKNAEYDYIERTFDVADIDNGYNFHLSLIEMEVF